jgi:RNA polymerase sigma-70 factor (ECF subfamily)
LHQANGGWAPYSIVRVEMTDHLIRRVVDYKHCPWVLAAASSVIVDRF